MALRTSSLSALLVLAGACAACSGAPSVAQVSIAPAQQDGPAAKEDATRASVIAAKKPAGFALDGDIAEWGDIVPAPKPPAPPPAKGPDPKAPAKPAPLPPASHLAIAIDSDGVTIAGQLTAEAADGLWIGIVLDDPVVPVIGYLERWRGVVPLDCDADAAGNPREPADAASCQALLDSRNAFEDSNARRFRRFYKLDRDGIRGAKPDGTLEPIAGSKVLFKPAKTGVTIEASFPQKALPRTLQAPLVDIAVVARAVPGNKAPEIPRTDFAPVRLPEAVGFEPYAALREAAFFMERSKIVGDLTISYQPGDGLELEDIGYVGSSTMAVEVKKVSLFSKQQAIGDFDVGYAYTGTTCVAVLKGTTFFDIRALDGAPIGMAQRGDELHVFSFLESQSDDSMGVAEARWDAAAVGKDGKLRTEIVEPAIQAYRWTFETEFHDADFARFGIDGNLADDSTPGVQATATWSWDAEAKAYTVKIERADDPPKKGKPGGKTKAPAKKDKASPKDKTVAPARKK